MKPPKHYPGALVPEHLTTTTVEHLPVDRPYYISPGEAKDPDEPLTIFTTDDRILRMSRTAIVDGDADMPQMPMGQVGIMRTFVTDEHVGMREVYVADLRLVDNYQIVNLGSANLFESDQEDFMDWNAMVSDTIQIAGFIAPGDEDEFDPSHDLPKGTLHGDQSLHQSLKQLRKRSDKLMRRFGEREAKSDITVEPEAADEAEGTPAAEKSRRRVGRGGLKAVLPGLRGMLSVRRAD